MSVNVILSNIFLDLVSLSTLAANVDIPTKVPHRSAQKYAINSGAKVAR